VKAFKVWKTKMEFLYIDKKNEYFGFGHLPKQNKTNKQTKKTKKQTNIILVC